MWMKQTYKGLASGIIYASKGDKVHVIRVEECLTFVEFNGEKFHVQHAYLSDVFVPADTQIIQELPVINSKPVNLKSKAKINSQTQLF